MLGNCKKKRTLFNLFEVYQCDNCIKYNMDTSYNIGDTLLNIYHINNGCSDNDLSFFDIAYSKKLKLFLKDAVINSLNKKEFTIVWLDNFNIERNDMILFDLLSFEDDIHVICD